MRFCYGLLAMPAAGELLRARPTPRGMWRCLQPVLLILSHSTIRELIERAAARVLGGDPGAVYLGKKGDER